MTGKPECLQVGRLLPITRKCPQTSVAIHRHPIAIPLFLTFRFLFAYYDLGYPGPTVGRHEFAPRRK